MHGPWAEKGGGTNKATVWFLIAVATVPSSSSCLEVDPSLSKLMDKLVPGAQMELSLPQQRQTLNQKVGLISTVHRFTNRQNDDILTTPEYKVIKSKAGSNIS